MDIHRTAEHQRWQQVRGFEQRHPGLVSGLTACGWTLALFERVEAGTSGGIGFVGGGSGEGSGNGVGGGSGSGSGLGSGGMGSGLMDVLQCKVLHRARRLK
jgi:hypothetical protein